MAEVSIAGKKHTVGQKDLIGEGGEAEIFRVSSDTALKLFKQPDHPCFQGSSPESAAIRESVRHKLEEMERKLSAMPRNLPPQVVPPAEMAYDCVRKSRFLGYTMQYLGGYQALKQYAQKDFRQAYTIANQEISEIFMDLHHATVELHQKGVVIGDFNPLNIMVSGDKVRLIDVDSMQFAAFSCSSFMTRYLDPLAGSKTSSAMVPVKPYAPSTDWYAFSVLLFESLLCVHPYGGVHRPGSGQKKLTFEERIHQRVSVFDKQVQYPFAAFELDSIPKKLKDYFIDVFLCDRREPFPLKLLEDLFGALPVLSRVPALTTQSGGDDEAFVTSVYRTAGTILAAALVNGKFCYLVMEEGKFKREGGQVVMSGRVDPSMKFRLLESRTAVARNTQLVVLGDGNRQRFSIDTYRQDSSVLAASGARLFVLSSGSLSSIESGKLQIFSEAITNQTRVWAGDKFGFGFAQAGELKRAFLFDVDLSWRSNLETDVIAGRPQEIECYFSDSAIWIFYTVEQNGCLSNQLSVLNNRGELLARVQCPEGDDSFLGSIRGKAARSFIHNGIESHGLLSAANGAIEQIELLPGGGFSLRKITAPGVSASDGLVLSNRGLYVWNRSEIRLLSTSGSNADTRQAAAGNSVNQIR